MVCPKAKQQCLINVGAFILASRARKAGKAIVVKAWWNYFSVNPIKWQKKQWQLWPDLIFSESIYLQCGISSKNVHVMMKYCIVDLVYLKVTSLLEIGKIIATNSVSKNLLCLSLHFTRHCMHSINYIQFVYNYVDILVDRQRRQTIILRIRLNPCNR